MKYYVVADVHSFYAETKKALTEKGFFEDKEPHKLIVCGDAFDRGDESKEMQEFILDLIEKDEVILIKGNHDDLIEEIHRNAEKWFGYGNIHRSHHWHNGTVKTVMDLTGIKEDELRDFEKVQTALSETPLFKSILPKMIDYYETEQYIFVHGWIPCDARGYGGYADYFDYNKNWRKSKTIDWEHARWYNGMEAWHQGVVEPNKTIVCGHWHCNYGHMYYGDDDRNYTPFIKEGIIALDGCVALTRNVNCIVLED